MADFFVVSLTLAAFHALCIVLLRASSQWRQWRVAGIFQTYAGLLLIWFCIPCVFWLLFAWPIQAVQQTQSFTSAILLSLAVGFVVLGLQRYWPKVAQLEQRNTFSLKRLPNDQHHMDFWVSCASGFALLLLASPAILAAFNWAFWPTGASLWLIAYGVLAIAWHAFVLQLKFHPIALNTPQTDTTNATLVSSFEIQDPDTKLFQAVSHGQIDAAIDAIRAGANPHQLPHAKAKDQRSLMMIACTFSDLRLLRELIANGVNINAFHNGLNPLLCATRDSWHGRSEAVTMLLTNGANSNVQDREGNTPLHHAMRSTDAAVAALLLDSGAAIDAINHEAYSPLALACQAANWRIARYMLERKAKLEPENAVPVLVAAAGAEDDEIGVRMLHKHKAKIDVRDAMQRTPLMVAAQTGLVEVLSCLLELGANINAQDQFGMSAYMHAAQFGEVDVLKKLQSHSKLNKTLLDNDGKSAFDHALGNGRWSAIACIDPSYPVPEHALQNAQHESQNAGLQELHDCLHENNIAGAQHLLDRGITFNTEQFSNCLVDYANATHSAAAHWLIQQGAHAFTKDFDGQTVYQRVLANPNSFTQSISFFLEHAQPLVGHAVLSDYLQACLLHERHTFAEQQLALQLLSQGAEGFSISSQSESTSLIFATRLGWEVLVDALLNAGVDVNAVDASGFSALHYAAQLSNKNALSKLILFGANPNAPARNGESALGLALQKSNNECVAVLSWPKWQLPGRKLHGGDIAAAVFAKDELAVSQLLNYPLDVNAMDKKGSTGLIHACGLGLQPIVERLIARGANLNKPARSGASALWAGISQGRLEIVHCLLQHGADANQAVGGYPPLHLACASGVPELVSALLAFGANANALDSQNQSALHACANYLSSEQAKVNSVYLMDSLIRAGTHIQHADKHQQTCLHLLCGASLPQTQKLNEHIVASALERLLQEAPELNAVDSRGFTALHHAAARGYFQLVTHLLASGADKQLRDNLGRTADDFAVMGGFSELSKVLQPRPERIEIANLLITKDSP